MAVIDLDKVQAIGGGAVFLWETVTATDTGEPIEILGHAGLACAVQAIGTFGGTLAIEGSIDGTNYVTLKTTQGDDATLTAAGVLEIATAVRYIRPSAGAGVSDVDVYICIRRG